MIASYNIELLFAKTGKTHTIRETLFLSVVEEVLTTYQSFTFHFQVFIKKIFITLN